MQTDNLKGLIKGIREESSPLVLLTNQLIEYYTKDLDNSISDLQIIMDSIGEISIEDIPNSEIEYYCVKIPSLMYYAGTKLEELGIQMDLAANQKKAALNQILLDTKGTAVERKARAEALTEDNTLVEAVYKRAYNTLKAKLDMADKIYSALKKSLTKRIAEADLDRHSKDAYLGDAYRFNGRKVM